MAALLLKQKGYDVVGVYFDLFGNGQEDWLTVQKVGQKLKIKTLRANFKRDFQKRVVDYFCSAYQKGTTPNPCVVCNPQIKFGLFWRWARKKKADFIATGHYACSQPKSPATFKILRAKDKRKDQSYFLYRLTQNDLRHVLFPVGSYTKKEVVKIAQKNKLPNAGKASSQDVCFLQNLKLGSYLEKNLKTQKKAGLIKELETKRVLGEHQGLLFFTLGQRSGLGLAGGPWYVADKKKAKNILYVTKNKKNIWQNVFQAQKINWISFREPRYPLETKAQIRYQGEVVKATVKKAGSRKIKVFLQKSLFAPTPGQSVVFYRGDEVLGGGIIN